MADPTHPTASPATVVVVDARPAGGRDRAGHALFALDVTVLAGHRDPFRTRLSVGVPDEAVRLVHPGAELPAVLVGEGERAVPVLDLAAALDLAGVLDRVGVVAPPAPDGAGTNEGGNR